LIALGEVLRWGINIYIFLIVIDAFLSWVNPDPFNPIVVFLRRSTEPVLAPLRRRIPPLGGIDFTPLIAVFILVFLRIFIAQSLIEWGFRVKHGY